MPSKKIGKVISLVFAIIFVVLSLGNIVLRVQSCLTIEKPVYPPTEYSPPSVEAKWIAYKKFCRNPVPYIILLLSGWYLTRVVWKYKDSNSGVV